MCLFITRMIKNSNNNYRKNTIITKISFVEYIRFSVSEKSNNVLKIRYDKKINGKTNSKSESGCKNDYQIAEICSKDRK